MNIIEHDRNSVINVFIPTRISSHSYLKLLYGNLEKKGVKCDDFLKIGDIKNIFRNDIIHLHWIEFYMRSARGSVFTYIKFACYLILLIVIKYILRKRIVVTLHNLKPHEMLYPRIEHLGFKFSLNIADALIAHNEWSKKSASKIYKIDDEKIYIVPIGNFIGYYPNNINRTEAREILDIPIDAFVILYFGLIRKYKGLDFLLSAIEDLSDHNIWILICGKPDDEAIKDNLLNYRENNKNIILNMNYVSDDSIQVYMNAADVGILPYNEITTSAVLLLFASFGKVVIASDLEPIKETIGDLAIYYNSDDVEDLKNKILESKKIDLNEISESIFKKACEYKWDDIANSTYNVYMEVINK